MAHGLLDQLSREILSDIFQESISNNGKIDAVSYRADHEDWIDTLSHFESRQLLKREGDSYRISFVVLSLLEDVAANDQLRNCEKVFNVLRAHYKDPATRHNEKKISEIAKDIDRTYDQTVQAISYMMDISYEWSGGSSTDLWKPETSYVKSGERILRNKTFTDLIAKVQSSFEQDITRFQGTALNNPPVWSQIEDLDQDELGAEPTSNRVFVVHGHNHGAKEAVARFLEKLDLDPVILHEKPNAGRTIIEKFSDYADVSFAVVLLTADDEGKSKDSSEDLKARARQNVILEFGYFLGKLGRANVCALYEDGVEIPSDYQGVLFVPYDSAGRWKNELVKELRAAGFSVDANKVF
jgi:predicted nucleotide-binding protein